MTSLINYVTVGLVLTSRCYAWPPHCGQLDFVVDQIDFARGLLIQAHIMLGWLDLVLTRSLLCEEYAIYG